MDDQMFTNIDDIQDPVLLSLNNNNETDLDPVLDPKHKSPNLKKLDENVSNIHLDVVKTVNDSDVLFNESNILLIFILLLAGLPQGNNLIASFKFIKGDIVITIIKSLMLFLIYYIVSRFIL